MTSQDSPRGCELRSLVLEHPRGDSVAATLRQLGIEAAVKTAETAVLRAKILTPKGELYL